MQAGLYRLFLKNFLTYHLTRGAAYRISSLIQQMGILLQVNKGTLEVVDMPTHSSSNGHDVGFWSWFSFANNCTSPVSTAFKSPALRSREMDLFTDVAHSPTNLDDVLSWIEWEFFWPNGIAFVSIPADVATDMNISFVDKFVPED